MIPDGQRVGAVNAAELVRLLAAVPGRVFLDGPVFFATKCLLPSDPIDQVDVLSPFDAMPVKGIAFDAGSAATRRCRPGRC